MTVKIPGLLWIPFVLMCLAWGYAGVELGLALRDENARSWAWHDKVLLNCAPRGRASFRGENDWNNAGQPGIPWRDMPWPVDPKTKRPTRPQG